MYVEEKDKQKIARGLTEMTPVKHNVRCQRIQWFWRVVRGNDDNIIEEVMPWKPTGQRPRGCPRRDG